MGSVLLIEEVDELGPQDVKPYGSDLFNDVVLSALVSEGLRATLSVYRGKTWTTSAEPFSFVPRSPATAESPWFARPSIKAVGQLKNCISTGNLRNRKTTYTSPAHVLEAWAEVADQVSQQDLALGWGIGCPPRVG
ncbi:MAG: hypothetical protein QG597_510 [Actinomycetota bacterium]|nr:hypothetical protein [Actinomycetota bacterium]